MTIRQDAQQPSIDRIIELWEVHLDVLDPTFSPLYLTNDLGGSIEWNGNTYLQCPIMGEGFGGTMNAAPNRPKVTINNVGGFLLPAIVQLGDIVGAPVYRIRTLYKYVESQEFGQTFPIERFVVIQKEIQSPRDVVFTLGQKIDTGMLTLPKRQITAKLFPGVTRRGMRIR
jgi:lambda family phage minor tail protein L